MNDTALDIRTTGEQHEIRIELGGNARQAEIGIGGETAEAQLRTEENTRDVRVSVSGSARQTTIGVERSVTPYDRYTGEYEVTPRLWEQELATARKALQRDVVVHEIPVASVSNPTGGWTVTIG